MKVSETLAARIREEVTKLAPEPIGHVNYDGIRHGAFPVVGTIGAVVLLRPDGSLWVVDSDDGLPLQPLAEHLRTMALAAGAQRHPWWSELLPDRPNEAVDCDACGGTGGRAAGQMLCRECSALGWLVPEVRG